MTKKHLEDKNHVCIFCEEDVIVIPKDDLDLDDKLVHDVFWLGIDRPIYINLLVHKSCYQDMITASKLQIFLNENLYDYIDKYYDMEEQSSGKKKPKEPSKHKLRQTVPLTD